MTKLNLSKESLEDRIVQLLEVADYNFNLTKTLNNYIAENKYDTKRNIYTLIANDAFACVIIDINTILFGADHEISFNNWGKFSPESLQSREFQDLKNKFTIFKKFRDTFFAHKHAATSGDPLHYAIVPIDKKHILTVEELIKSIKSFIDSSHGFKERCNYVTFGLNKEDFQKLLND